MEANKKIRVYGTLMNHTLDRTISDNTHNDALAYVYQLYDDRFGVTPNADNFQDVINKRLTAISYADGVTTIENRDHSQGNPYMLVVNGNTNLNGKLDVQGDTHLHEDLQVDGDTNIGGNLTVEGDIIVNGESIGGFDPSDLQAQIDQLKADVNALKQLWYLSSDGTRVISDRPAVAAGFYDSTMNA